MEKSDQIEDYERIDTFQLVFQMTQSMGGLQKGKHSKMAYIYGTSRSRLRSILNREAKAPTLDTVVSWMHRVYRLTGMKVVLTITPDLKMHYSILSQNQERIDGMIVPPKNSL
jgi:hypothetical protein|tara:strand:- start:10095 stop:10433 length:339 start_codon:yes stop_codon:yes gene_type:complete